MTIQLDIEGAVTLTTDLVNNGSNDNCGVAGLSLSKTAFGCTDVGTQSVILTVTDPSGLSSQCQAMITVQDIIPPTMVCKEVTIFLDGLGKASITTADVDVASNDACGLASLVLDQYEFDCNDLGLNTVTLTAEDNNGNVASCTSNVVVVDNQAPNPECKDVTVTLNAAGQASITNAQVDNGTSDNCDFDISLSQYDFGYDDYPSTTVTLTATDEAGNSNSCDAIVTVIIPCDNITSGGSIGEDEFGCGAFDPAPITSQTPASGGGNAPIEYLWLATTDPHLPITQWTPVGTQPDYDPATISETTYYIRCARRLGCTVYSGESNVVAKVVNGTGEACDPDQESVSISGNATSYFNNHGVSYPNNMLGAIDGQGAQFYSYNDNIRVQLPDYLPAGSEVTITWKRRNYGGFYPARMLVYENRTNGNGSFLNDIFFTQVTNFYISSTITIQQDGVTSLWIRNAPGYADFEVDAISYCATVCISDLEYCTPEHISTEYEYIRRVKLNTINNWTGDDDGYGDYTHLSTTLNAGQGYQIRLRPGFQNASYVEFWRVYIDFDQDGEFEGHEKVYQGRGRFEKVGHVYIPSWARAGETRMRVIMRYGGYAHPCSDGFEGEIEDYTVNINSGNIELEWRPGEEEAIANNLEQDLSTLEADEEFVVTDRSDAQPIDTESEPPIAAVLEPTMKVYPNPSNGPVTIDLAGFSTGESVKLIITDQLGAQVLNRSLNNGAGQRYLLYPDDQGMVPGTYLVTATNGEQRITKRLVILR